MPARRKRRNRNRTHRHSRCRNRKRARSSTHSSLCEQKDHSKDHHSANGRTSRSSIRMGLDNRKPALHRNRYRIHTQQRRRKTLHSIRCYSNR
jgi:hypothetical protein